MAMPQWRCSFSVNGKKTEMIVAANSSIDAKKLVEAQYAGAKITWWSCTRA